MPTVREIAADELARWVAVMASSGRDTATLDEYLDWRRQARSTVWLLATDVDGDVGAAIGVEGWHSPQGVARAEVRVIPRARGRGTAGTLLESVAAWATAHGCGELTGPVAEDDAESLAWAKRRGFDEVGRDSRLSLDLTAIVSPEIDPPDGVEIVTWASRPGLERGMYEVAREAYVDVPGDGEAGVEPFERWLAMDMHGVGDRPEATFVALVGGDVVGYAKLSLSSARPTMAMHDITGVRRAFRRRGIAGALKRAEIAWARESGYERLETLNEERNEPIRRLNERYGYRRVPGTITVRGSVEGLV